MAALPAVKHADIDPNLFANLHHFCREGLLEELRYALNYEKDVLNYFLIRTQRGSTLLHEAVECDQADIVQLLLLKNVSPNIRAKAGVTPLHLACSKGHVDCVTALLEGGADIYIRDDLGHDSISKCERSKKRDAVLKLVRSREIILFASKGDIRTLERRLKQGPKPKLKDIDEALLAAVRNSHDSCIPLLVVAGARHLDCALYLAIQTERTKSIAILLLCKATIMGDCAAIRSLLNEPPECDNVPWYMGEVHKILSQGAVKMSYPIAVSIMEKNYEATKELLLQTDLDMRRKHVDWSKLKLTLLHHTWIYSIAPWVVTLKLVNNHLRKLPEEIGGAYQLRRLDISQNLLTTVPANLFALPGLEYLNLSHNQLKELPDTTSWTNSLLSLDLSENDLTTLPSGMQNSVIEILNLSKNQFTSVPKCLCRIRSLTSLDISSMPISALPKEMEQLDHLVNLNVSNVNINDLPAGVLRGAIKGIFKARARSSKACNYVKLVVLCHTEAVKGIMYSRLKPHASSSSPVPEMDVFHWSYRPIFTKKLFSNQKLHFNTWLIGSSYEYCSIFPCFFTPSALYVIVWDMARTGEMREEIKLYVDYLVRYVPKANVLVIAILPESLEVWAEASVDNLFKRLTTFFGRPAYQTLHYHGLLVMATNSNIKEGQTDIKQRLYDVATATLVNGQPLVGRQFPENYFALIPAVEKELAMFRTRSKPGVLDETSIWRLFEQALSSDSPDRMELPVMVDFLKEAGFLLHYEDPNCRLDQQYFIRPVWLYSTLLRVLRHTLQYSSNITVTYTELCSLANVDWSKDVSSAIVRLMVRYAIVLPIKKSLYMLPCLLPHSKPPSSLLSVGNLRRQFVPRNKPLPIDLWSRVVCRILSNLDKIGEMKEVRRKVISTSSYHTDEAKEGEEDDAEMLGGGTDDEMGVEESVQKAPKRVPSLERFKSEPYLKPIAKMPRPICVEETNLDTRHRTFEPLPLSPIVNYEEDNCPIVCSPYHEPHEIESSGEFYVPTPDDVDNSLEHSGLANAKSPTTDEQLKTVKDTISPLSDVGNPLSSPLSPMSSTPGLELREVNATAVLSQEPSGADKHTTTLNSPDSSRTQSSGITGSGSNSKQEKSTDESLDEKLDKLQTSDSSQEKSYDDADTISDLVEQRSQLRTQTTLGVGDFEPPDYNRHASLPARPRLQRIASAPPRKREVRRGTYVDPVVYTVGVKVWNSGIICERDDVKFALYPCVCDVSTAEEGGIEICSSRNTVGRVVMARICWLVQKLLEERFPEMFSVDRVLQKHEMTQLAICPICVDAGIKDPTNFLVEACVHALQEKDMHNCRYHAEAVPLRDLVPDYLMVDLPSAYRLTSSSFNYNESKPLYRGRSTFLHHGTFQGHSMAIKVYQAMEGKSVTLPLSSIRQEMNMLIHLEHPNIVSTYGFCLQPSCVLLEKAPLGNLYQKLMDTEQKFGRSVRFHIGCQVASALNYLHKRDIVYRTLKASSILVWSLDYCDEVNVKLANFERTENMSPSGLLGKTSFASYPAPEMLRYSFREEYSEKIDIYSFGILLYELVSRWQPFGGIYNSDRIPISQRPKLTHVVTTGYGTMVQTMQQCWQEDPTLRPNASSLVKELSQPAFQCHLASQVLRDCLSVRGCCFVPSVRQIWAYGEYNRDIDDGTELPEGTQVFILNAENLTVQGSLELRERASAIFSVDSKVWIGMTEACVHVYDAATYRFTDRSHLIDSVTVIADNDTYVFVAQASGQLTYYQKLKFPKGSRTIDIGTMPIITMITVSEDIWLSCGNELVVLNADDEVFIEKRWEACDKQYLINCLVLSNDGAIVWSLVRGELSIASWSATSGDKLCKVDISEDLKWICCELNYDPSFIRLASLVCVQDTLWVGVSNGIIVILTANEHPEVITHFCAHKSSTKCLLEIPRCDVVKDDTPVVLSGGFGEISSNASPMSEQNGVIMSWQALTAAEFRLLSRRFNKY